MEKCTRWGIPTLTGPFSAAEAAEAITEHGGVVLSGVVPDAMLASAVDEFDALYPPWPDYLDRVVAEGRSPGDLTADSDELQQSGPFGTPALDGIPLLEPLQAVVTEILGPSAVVQLSHLWVKYGQLAKDFDLPLHSDYSNHTIVYPSDDPRFQVVHAIAYYSDVTIDDGPTYVVPRSVSRDHPLVPIFHPRSEAPGLYEQESPVTAPSGSILLYGTKLLHRASVMRDEQGRRRSHFFAYGPPDVPWLGWGRWLCSWPGPSRQAFIENCRPEDLRRIGFPAPESEYWTDETIKGTALMYPGLALADYLKST